MADSWPGSSYSYRDTGSFCHHVFKQNVIPAIRLSFLAALSQCCEKVQWLIVLLPNASRLLCACAFSHVLHPLPECSTHHSQLCSFFSTTAWGRAPLLFWVYECVHEVLCVCDRPIHFCPCLSSPTVLKRKSLLSCHAGAQSVSMWAFPSFTTENKPTHILWQFHWLFFCQAKCVWLGTSTVCQAGYPAVLFNINLLLIVTLDMQTSLSKKPE